ncbi:hypothetical protein JT306_03980 [Salmonella enterica subsp. enterica serovar Kentucky]|nr:hypothetical protein [Salmonella enterica subsp. enterica serovar Kentucky]
MSTASSAIPSLTAGARRSAGSTDLNGTASTGWCALPTCASFARHSWRYEFDNDVTTLYPCPTRKSSVSSLLTPFKLTASHGRYLLVNPGLWVRRSRSVKYDAMFSPSGAFLA